jgi:hypothetical protein
MSSIYIATTLATCHRINQPVAGQCRSNRRPQKYMPVRVGVESTKENSMDGNVQEVKTTLSGQCRQQMDIAGTAQSSHSTPFT